jgi:hypothetical protein
MQPCERCDQPGWQCSPTDYLVRESQSAVARGDLPGAITKMEAAVERAQSTRFMGPWVHLAELYCVQAAREKDPAAAAVQRRKGVSLLREDRCAKRLGASSLSCALPNWRNEASREWLPFEERHSVETANSAPWGFVPHPDLTPMCFRAFCGSGFQNDEDRERRSRNLNPGDEEAGDISEVMAEAGERAGQALTAAAERWCGVGSKKPR